MTKICGFDRFDNIRTNAQLSNDIIDTQYSFDRQLAKYAENHLKDCKENPTLGLLARQNQRTNYYPKSAKINMAMLNEQDSFIRADNEFKQVCQDMYHKTNKVRRQLIKKESIVLDNIEPIKKNFTRTMIKLFGNLMK